MNATQALLAPARAAGLGSKPALVWPDGALTYDELELLVNRLGHGLKRLGVQPGDRVLFLLKDSAELVAAYLATMKIGAVAVALNIRASADDLHFFVTDSDAAVLFVDAEFLPQWRVASSRLSPRMGRQPKVVVVGDGGDNFAALHTGMPAALDALLLPPEAMAFWIYTSGTTGQPKAAVHAQRAVLQGDVLAREVLGLDANAVLFGTSKLFFAYTLGNVLFGGLRLAATIVLHAGWPDAAAIAGMVERFAPTVVFSVPTMYRNLLRDGVAGGPAFARVRHYVSAGERLPATLIARFAEATGREIVDGMGTTETIYLVLANRPGAVRRGSAGRPSPLGEVELRDEQGSRIDTPDMPGVLHVRLPALAAGYWNQPARTASAFADGWFRTGDMFRIDADGYWFHEGRADDMLKISGQWVSPGEIEDVAQRLPGVADAVVVGHANDDGLTRLCLFLVPASAGDGGIAARVQSGLLERLAVYKCPRDIRLVPEIPRTATGKAQRFRLRQLAQENAP